MNLSNTPRTWSSRMFGRVCMLKASTGLVCLFVICTIFIYIYSDRSAEHVESGSPIHKNRVMTTPSTQYGRNSVSYSIELQSVLPSIVREKNFTHSTNFANDSISTSDMLLKNIVAAVHLLYVGSPWSSPFAWSNSFIQTMSEIGQCLIRACTFRNFSSRDFLTDWFRATTV